MKKILALLFIIMTLLQTACTSNSGVIINGHERNTATSLNMSYDKFTGVKKKTITLDDEATMNVDIKTDSGVLNLSVKGEDGKSFYTGTGLPTSNFQFSLDGAGNYEITITCDDHKGGYAIFWGEN